MRILVTGAAGFIGSHLAERLAGLGHEVVGLDCFSDYYARSLKDLNAADVKKSGARIFELDLAVDDLCEAVKDIEVVYHCAAQPGISEATSFDDYKRNNITATHRLLDALKMSSSFKMFVNVSTSSVYGKFATESEVKDRLGTQALALYPRLRTHSSKEIPEELQEELRALGYIE